MNENLNVRLTAEEMHLLFNLRELFPYIVQQTYKVEPGIKREAAKLPEWTVEEILAREG